MRKSDFGPGNPVTIAVRPEKIQLQWQRPMAAGTIAGRVNSEAYFGDRSHYFVEVAKLQTPVAVAMQNSRPSAPTSEGRGRDVWLTWEPEAAILLSQDQSSAA